MSYIMNDFESMNCESHECERVELNIIFPKHEGSFIFFSKLDPKDRIALNAFINA